MENREGPPGEPDHVQLVVAAVTDMRVPPAVTTVTVAAAIMNASVDVTAAVFAITVTDPVVVDVVLTQHPCLDLTQHPYLDLTQHPYLDLTQHPYLDPT